MQTSWRNKNNSWGSYVRGWRSITMCVNLWKSDLSKVDLSRTCLKNIPGHFTSGTHCRLLQPTPYYGKCNPVNLSKLCLSTTDLCAAEFFFWGAHATSQEPNPFVSFNTRLEKFFRWAGLGWKGWLGSGSPTFEDPDIQWVFVNPAPYGVNSWVLDAP